MYACSHHMRANFECSPIARSLNCEFSSNFRPPPKEAVFAGSFACPLAQAKNNKTLKCTLMNIQRLAIGNQLGGLWIGCVRCVWRLNSKPSRASEHSTCKWRAASEVEKEYRHSNIRATRASIAATPSVRQQQHTHPRASLCLRMFVFLCV